MASTIIKSRLQFAYATVGCLLFASSTFVVTSFSTVGENSYNRALWDRKFESTQQWRHLSYSNRFGSNNDRNEASKIMRMVAEGGSTTSMCSDTEQKECSSKITLIWKRLLDWFQGDFDNYAQVVEDRKLNLEPREGGGHEHFHCTLVPVTESTRLAAFFFDGNPDRIFRFRFYEIIPPTDNDETIEMMLNTLHPDLEKLLKSQASNPLSWPHLFQNFEPKEDKNPKVNRLKKCEISWSLDRDPIEHSYLTSTPENESATSSESIHAVMVHGPTVVNSTVIPGMKIRIVDQLSLYQDVFYINDRGFDPITGSFIYGNQREVPYRLERVSFISSNTTDTITSPQSLDNGELKRIIKNSDLEWTMGPDFRSTDEYSRKMKLIGGPSVAMNKKSFKKDDPN